MRRSCALRDWGWREQTYLQHVTNDLGGFRLAIVVALDDPRQELTCVDGAEWMDGSLT
jgi:hypothetical protein